jgi:hypothetical protein
VKRAYRRRGAKEEKETNQNRYCSSRVEGNICLYLAHDNDGGFKNRAEESDGEEDREEEA